MATASLEVSIPKQIEIHTTDRGVFKDCRLQWHFSSPIRLNLEPLVKPQPFTFGTAYHAGMEAYYEPTHDTRDMTRGITAFLESLNTWKANAPQTVETDEMYAEMIQLGPGMLDHYSRWAGREDRFEVIWVEKPYTIHLYDYEGIPVVYSFKPDGLVRDKQNRYWLLEHKTAAKFDDTYDFLLRDDQCGSYIWGIWEADGIKVEGVIYTQSAKRVPTMPKVLASGMLSADKRIMATEESYKEAIVMHHGRPMYEPYEGILQVLRDRDAENHRFFHREFVRRNHREIMAVGNSIRELEVPEMIENPRIYRRPDPFKCRLCAFQVPCLVYYEGGDLENTLRNQYKEKE